MQYDFPRTLPPPRGPSLIAAALFAVAATAALSARGAMPTRDYAIVQVTGLDGQHANPASVTECVTPYGNLVAGNGAVSVRQEIGSAVGLNGPVTVAITNVSTRPSAAFNGNVRSVAQLAATEAEPLQQSTLAGSCPITATGRRAVFVVTNVPGRGVIPVLVDFHCNGKGETQAGTTEAGSRLSALLTAPPSACAALRGGAFLPE